MMNLLKMFGGLILISLVNWVSAIELTDELASKEGTSISNIQDFRDQVEIQEKFCEKFVRMRSLESTIYDVIQRNLSRLDELVAALDPNENDINAEICSIFDFVSSPMSQLNSLISVMRVNSAVFSFRRSIFFSTVESQFWTLLQSESMSTFLTQDKVIQDDINRFKGYKKKLKRVKGANQLSLQLIRGIKQEFVDFSTNVQEHVNVLDRIISEKKAEIDKLKNRKNRTERKE